MTNIFKSIKSKLFIFSSIATLIFGFVSIAGADAATCVSQLWVEGDKGTCVSYIQEILDDEIPKQVNISPNGTFGTNTYNAVVTFQHDEGISGGNGQVGSRTWSSMCTAPNVIYTYPNAKANAGC